jgi:hypothetical protein
MMIEKRSIEELLEVARLEDVVGQFVTLTGRVNLKGDKCPFCGSTKKFTVSKAKQIYKCFECEKGGNSPLKFLMDGRGMDYRASVTWLADYYKFILREVDGAAATGDGYDTSYFHERMEAIRYVQDRPEDKGLFRARTDGGIEIRYPNLYPGEPWQQHKGADFVRTRLHPTKVSSKGKYSQPDGSGIRIFIPPCVVAEHRAGEKWETLYVVEGEFKAFAAARPGVPVVGIGGIQLFIEKKGSHNLHADLVQLLRNAQSVVLLHDADANEVKWDPAVEPDKDLGKRLRDFARAVTGFRRSVGTLVPLVRYTRIRSEWLAKAKGLDDLCAHEGSDRVVERLAANGTDQYFLVRDITKEDWKGINGLFHLNMIGGVPRAFYREHQNVLLEHSFRFCGGRFQWVRENEESEGSLEMLEHPDSKLFLAVGCDFYKKLVKEDHNKRPQQILEPWKESNLQRNYVRNGVPRFLHTLDTYDAFAVAPGHHEDYRTEVIVQAEEYGPKSRFLNKYRPLDHQPKPGKYPTIERYLKHVFGTDEVVTKNKAGTVLATSERWVVYLDRWTVMYRMPHQRVPAVVLASEERNTGKSTVLDLNMAMWGGNAVIIGNDAIASQFNANWIDCSYVGINEAMLKRKEDGEKLKDLMTSPVTQRRGMYREGEQSINFTKFDITTNSPDKFLEISNDEYRYLVIEVPMYEGDEDPDLMKKMTSEIPALFHDLRHREIVHPRVGRLWFANSVIDNEARREAAKASRSWCEKEVREWIEEQFYLYRWPELYFSGKQIRDLVNEQNGARFRLVEIKEVLQKKLKTAEDYTRIVVPDLPEKRELEQGMKGRVIGPKLKGRWYIFRAIDWVPAAVATEIMEEARCEWSKSTSCTDSIGGFEAFPLHHPERWPK